jgi:ATP-binding cassette subfamily B protein
MLVLQNGIALGWIAGEIIQGKISVAEFTFYSGAAIQFAQFMNRFVSTYSTVKQCSHDVQMVQEAFAWLPEKKAAPVEMTSGHPAPEIRFEHVTFSYPGTEEPVLKDISFRVRPGEKMALVGANGAGKTTIVKLLCGLYQPTEGRILIDGIPNSERKDEELYSLFSTVFQDKLVLPFSVLENVAVNGKADVERVRRCLEKAGLSQRFPDLNQPLVKGIQDGAENLSGGEEQKLLLARALYKEAPILVLDEPTAALDPLAESELYGKYNEFTREKTSFFISHRLASTGFCDRILLVGDGRILEEGSHRELLAKGGQYAHMFREQSKYYKNSLEADA